MSEILTILRTVFDQPNQHIRYRTSLNLPAYDGNFPFRQKQRNALELAISNAPITAIAGNLGSGKTEIALAALNIAIAHQRSTLVIVPFVSTFIGYQHLQLPPLEITEAQNYRESVKSWLGSQLSNPKLNFIPPHWLPDQLFEDLQAKRDRRFWLELLESLPDSINKSDKYQLHEQAKERIANTINQIYPSIHPARKQLLVHRLMQSKTLLQQREHLYQDYIHLSEPALDQMTDAVLPHFQASTLCTTQNLSKLEKLKFDLVIVEDSHYLNTQEMQVISNLGKKLVFLGDLVDRRNSFGKLFDNLLPSYRVELTENHRLNNDLVHQILPSLYPSHPFIYTATTQPTNSIVQGKAPVNWYDIKNPIQLRQKLYDLLEEILQDDRSKIPCFLIFSEASDQELQQLKQNLLQTFPQASKLEIYNIDNWHGQQCQNLWIVCEQDENQNQNNRPDVNNLRLLNLRLAFTRAKNQISIFGDRQYYQEQNIWQDLITDFSFVRDIKINEDK